VMSFTRCQSLDKQEKPPDGFESQRKNTGSL
jgi:hypothetical protein